jgi:hypothetical protein
MFARRCGGVLVGNTMKRSYEDTALSVVILVVISLVVACAIGVALVLVVKGGI